MGMELTDKIECSTCGWATENPASGCPTVLALAEAVGIEVPG